jgi:poly-gamma-glutamate synthesis protein (capsule biosynthesis protein)
MKTVENIQNAGLQAVGHYSPRVIEDLCEIVAMPVRLQTSAGGEERGALPLAICSFHYQFGFLPEPGELETIKQYSEVMPVIGMMHAGHEYTSKANEHQRSFAHQMIDYGAEFVVSNGAHWVQDTEVYKGKLIVYSTGNFIFDQLGYEERLGLSLAVDMSVPYDENLVGWLELGEDCKPRNDSFGGARRVTERASEVQQQDIERRANWAQTKRMLEAAVR